MALPSSKNVKLWLAILRELDLAGGLARPRIVYPRLRQYFPEITDADLARTTAGGENVWTNTIQWARLELVHRGYLDKTTRGVWRLTDAGRQWLQETGRGPHADYSAVPKPPCVTGRVPAERTGGAQPAPPALPIALVASQVEQLCQRLQTSQRQSTMPQQFEQTVAAAFQFLGFDAQHIGGAGDTDIFVRAALGPSSYSVIIDAKSTQVGRVTDAQINWPVIETHRQARGATYAAVVGEDFSGGQLQKFADQYKVTLITTGMLCELLRLHDQIPFSLIELRDLFMASGRADQAMQALRERHTQHRRHWRLIADIIDLVETFEQKMPGGFAPNVDSLHLLLSVRLIDTEQSLTDIPSKQDVAAAVTFLASRAVDVLTEVPGSHGDYQLTMTSATARERLRALASFIRILSSEARKNAQAGAVSSAGV